MPKSRSRRTKSTAGNSRRQVTGNKNDVPSTKYEQGKTRAQAHTTQPKTPSPEIQIIAGETGYTPLNEETPRHWVPRNHQETMSIVEGPKELGPDTFGTEQPRTGSFFQQYISNDMMDKIEESKDTGQGQIEDNDKQFEFEKKKEIALGSDVYEGDRFEETRNDVMCDPCEGESKATSYCQECEELLCEKCVASHKKRKATKNHDILPAEMSEDKMKLPKIEVKDTPGQPEAVEIMHDSIVLTWEPPTKFNNEDYYQISFKDMISDRKWRHYQEDVHDFSAAITGLKSNSTYIFRVRVIHGDGEESPFGPESNEISTTVSLATRMVNESLRITANGKTPIKYELPITEIDAARNEQAKTRKFEVGNRPSGRVECKTIMLVGATGTGKSTFVDGIINYVLGVSWEDPFRYTVINLEPEEKNHRENQALSQTEWITCYIIHPGCGGRLSYQLQIIDTPGFGDTRGLKRDHEIVGQIRQLFSNPEPKGVTCVDAVCFLIKAPDARLTPIQSYIFQSIMSLFGKDIEKNICSLITFADGNDPPVLAALAESKLPFGAHFTFNNSALFASNSSTEYQSLSPMFWKIGLSSFKDFFIHLNQMQTTSLQLTKDVLLERQRLEAIVRTLKENLDAGLLMVDVLKSERKVLEEHKTAMEANKNFEIEIEEPFVTKTRIPGQVHNTKCENCYVKCHPNCAVEDNEHKRYCAVMDKDGKCTVCPDRCMWRAHKNDAFNYIHGVKKVKKTLKEFQEKYNDASGKALSHKQIVAKNEAKLMKLTQNIEDMILLVKFCNERLEEIALKPNPLTMTEHIDLMIVNEERTKKEGFLQRIKVLNEFRKDAEVHKTAETFKKMATVELKETVGELNKEARPRDIKSVLKRATSLLKKYIPGFSI